MRFLEKIARIRLWTLEVQGATHGGNFSLHSSLLITLPLVAIVLASLSLSHPGFAEFRYACFTLPVVWFGSLIVRVASQQLAVGSYASRLKTVIGPAGNLSTDYERLNGPVMFSYGISGQAATLALALLGLIVTAAVTSSNQSPLTVSELLDFRCGWSSRDWASQLMWVNLFIASLHLLPTVPFDMRAIVCATWSIGRPRMSQPVLYRAIGYLDSHLSCLLLGISVASAVFEFNHPDYVTGWYITMAASIYLFVGGKWEHSRAAELEEHYSAPNIRSTPRPAPAQSVKVKKAHIDFRESQASENEADTGSAKATPSYDVDEILRKLYRYGRNALSQGEQDALLSASKQLQRRRSRS